MGEKSVPLAITLGDVSGVGPEIALRAWRDGAVPRDMVIIGDRSALEYCNERLGYGVPMKTVSGMESGNGSELTVWDMRIVAVDAIRPGKVSLESGLAALRYLRTAVASALEGKARAVVTLPMNKEATRLSTPDFTGHTDVIAEMCGAADYTMALISDEFIVPHVSAHVSLKEAIELVTRERVCTVTWLAADACARLGRTAKIAVMGLNPHAGEAGAFGAEEERAIAPAVSQLRSEGLEVVGPVPPDTAFMRALKGEFTVIVCMYHDQGHIAMKTIGLDDAVNVTLGLPIVRTSVDHGTAYDIAYQGVASTGSYVKACRLADGLCG